MTRKPIIFSGEMVNRILAAEKVVTRRIDKCPDQGPRYAVGDTLWVREEWEIINTPAADYIVYCADSEQRLIDGAYPPHVSNRQTQSPIFLPRSYSRIDLKVTAVRTEPLKSMQRIDALQEGFMSVRGFAEFWDRLYADKPEYQWESNPNVHVYSFERYKDAARNC